MFRLFSIIIVIMIILLMANHKGFALPRAGVGDDTMVVTVQEAILIAQNLMREKGLDKDWNIKKPKIHYENEKQIGIRFYTKHLFALNLKYALPYLIVVDKKNGEIVAWGQDK